MKTKFYSMLTAALLLATLFTGCSKEDGEERPSSNDQSVLVKLDLRNGTKSRAVAAPTTSESKELIFESGHIFFTAAAGAITKYYEILPDGDASTDLANGKVTISDLTNGFEMTDIPSNSTRVYMIGNIPGSLEIPTTGNISVVQELAIAVGTQNHSNGSTKVSMYGIGAIMDSTNPEHVGDVRKKEAALNVEVIAGRLEMNKLTCSDNIDSYNVEAVYINCYYPEITLGGSADPLTFVNNEEKLANYPAAVSGSETPYDGLNLHDWHVVPFQSVTKEVVPATGKAWVYNLLAPTKKMGGNTDNFARPHIIVRLNNIKLTSDDAPKDTYDEPMYLTMRLKDQETGSEIASFDPGKIYQIENVEFDETNLYDTPEKSTIDVSVTVTVVDWELVSTGVILN